MTARGPGLDMVCGYLVSGDYVDACVVRAVG
jgi:hypothetical protein